MDVKVIRSGNKLLTDLYIKPTNTNQYLEFSSCHVHYTKKFIPYSQALRFSRICSENMLFDNRCNQFECWLKDRGYNEKVNRQQILKVRKFTREDLLNQDSKTKGRNKLVFNFIYYPAYSKLKHILSNINLWLTPDAQNCKGFPKVSIVGFKRGKSLKDLLVTVKVPVEKETDKKSCRCQGKRYEICTFLEEKSTFTNKAGSDTYNIREGLHLDCNSENPVYLITCKNCKKQYIGSCIIWLRTRFNNYRHCHGKICRGHSVIQVSFHAHLMLDGHCGIDNWEIILIDKGRNKQEIRRKSFFYNIGLTRFYCMVSMGQ